MTIFLENEQEGTRGNQNETLDNIPQNLARYINKNGRVFESQVNQWTKCILFYHY